MSKLGIFAMAAQFASRFLQFRRGTWIAIGIGFLIFSALMIWAVLSLLGWIWGQGKALTASAPDTARMVAAQVEQAIPGARDTLGSLAPALKPEEPLRDVSGTDIGPVARYPGLVRAHWQRNGNEVMVHYEGRADYLSVLDHYVNSFAAQGYAQKVMVATQDSEEHHYRKHEERVIFKIAKQPQGKVQATIIATLPEPIIQEK